MKAKISLIQVLSLMTLALFAAGERYTSGSRQISLGFTSVALTDLWSQKNNQAGTAWVKEICTGLTVEKPYMTEGLGKYHLVVLMPFSAGTIGLGVSENGNRLYNEIMVGAGFARKFGNKFSAGVQIDYIRLNAGAEYGTKNLVSCELGLILQPTAEVVYGVHIVNPVPVKVIETGLETLPSSVTAGVSWLISKECTWLGEFEKMGIDPFRFRTGIEYRMLKTLSIRTGVATQPWVYTFGAGLHFGKLVMDIASQYHPALGFSPACSLAWHFTSRP